MTFSIRRALPTDARAIAEAHVQSWRETYPGIVPEDVIQGMSVDECAKMWGARLLEVPGPSRFTFVADFAGRGVVGFASGGALRKGQGADYEVPSTLSEIYDGELFAIYLIQEQQRTGIGRSLFRAVTQELGRLGHRSMLVRVLKDNPTKGFYERMGGKMVGEKKVKIGKMLDELIYGWEKIDEIAAMT